MLGSVLAIDRQAAQPQMLAVMWGGSLPVSPSVWVCPSRRPDDIFVAPLLMEVVAAGDTVAPGYGQLDLQSLRGSKAL